MSSISRLLIVAICWFASSAATAAPILYATGSIEAAGGGAGLWSVDTSTGQLTFVGPAGATIEQAGLAANDTTNTLYSLGQIGSVAALFTVNSATGLASPIAQFDNPDVYVGVWEGGLAFDQTTGLLYATGQSTAFSDHPDRYAVSTLFTIDPSTGIATPIGATGLNGAFPNLAFDPLTNVLYGTGRYGGPPDSKLYVFDPSTGVASEVAPIVGVDPTTIFGGLAFDPLTNVLYATGLTCNSIFCGSTLFSLDPTSGAASAIGPTLGANLSIGGLAFLDPCSPFPGGGATGGCFPGPGPFPGHPVPEPGTLSLFAAGLLALGVMRRRVAV